MLVDTRRVRVLDDDGGERGVLDDVR